MARRPRKIRAGMNIDHAAVRLVVVDAHDNIIWHGEELFDESTVIDGYLKDTSELAEKMGRLVGRAKLKSRQVALAWAPSRCLYRTMPLPTGAGKNLHQALLIDAEAQLSAIDKSLLQMHVYQRPEDGAAVYAYDKMALAAILEAAHLARVKITSLHHPVAGLVPLAEAGAVCYLGEGASYYAEGRKTPSYLRTLAIGSSDAPVERGALFDEGIERANDWVDELGQDILTTRVEVARQLGKAAPRIYFAGPTLSVPRLGRYMKTILTTAQIGTLRLPYTWPEGISAAEKILYSGALGAFTAPEESNILTQAEIQGLADTEIVEGGIRIENQEVSRRWVVGLAATFALILAISFAVSFGLGQLEDNKAEAEAAAENKTQQLSTSGNVKILGPADWAEREQAAQEIWEENAPMRELSVRALGLRDILIAGDLQPSNIEVADGVVTVSYTGDDNLLAGALESSGWEIVSAGQGEAKLK